MKCFFFFFCPAISQFILTTYFLQSINLKPKWVGKNKNRGLWKKKNQKYIKKYRFSKKNYNPEGITEKGHSSYGRRGKKGGIRGADRVMGKKRWA